MSKEMLRNDYKARWARISEGMRLANITSQKMLAEKLGVSQPSVSGWKNGDFLPEMQNVLQLAKLSGLCVEYIWLGRGPKFPGDRLDSETELLLEILHHLPTERKEQVIRFARFQGED